MSHSDHILLVEDDISGREALAALLRDDGYRVTIAGDAVEAIANVDHDPPDLVISDVRMPRGDGFHLVRRLRARAGGSQVPVLLISALSEPNRRAAGLELGADDFIAKPIAPEELLARVHAHLRRVHERHDLERRALVDSLTGVLNRRGIGEALHRQLAHAQARGTPLSVLMIDIDHFKRLNDEHGHAAGDTALRQVSRALADAVRIVDAVGRYGGDEFLILLAGADADAATALASRLATIRLPRLALPDGRDLDVTISVGAATLRHADTEDALLDRADRAMYEAKRTGAAPRVR